MMDISDVAKVTELTLAYNTAKELYTNPLHVYVTSSMNDYELLRARVDLTGDEAMLVLEKVLKRLTNELFNLGVEV